MCVRNLNNQNRYIKYVAKFREIRIIFLLYIFTRHISMTRNCDSGSRKNNENRKQFFNFNIALLSDRIS